MLKYLCLLVFSPFFQSKLEGVYTSHQQFCSITYFFNKDWTLTLNKDSSFTYNISEFLSKTRKTSVVETKGKWLVVQDTLRLQSVTTPETFIFIIDGTTLKPVNEKEVISYGFSNKLYSLKKKNQ